MHGSSGSSVHKGHKKSSSTTATHTTSNNYKKSKRPVKTKFPSPKGPLLLKSHRSFATKSTKQQNTSLSTTTSQSLQSSQPSNDHAKPILSLPSARTYTRLLVLDAFSILFRSHFALAKSHLRRGVDGRVVSGLSGFTNTLLKITKEVKPTHIAVCMDTPATIGFRRKLFPLYKKDRGGRDDDLVWQIQQLPYVVQALGIPTLFVPGFEADDILASICHKVKDEKEDLKELFLDHFKGDEDTMTKIQTENKFFDDGYGVFGSNMMNQYQRQSTIKKNSTLLEFDNNDHDDDNTNTSPTQSTRRLKVSTTTNPLTGDDEDILVKKSHPELMWQKDFHFTKIQKIPVAPKKDKKSTSKSSSKATIANEEPVVPAVALVSLDMVKNTLRSLQEACVDEYYAANPTQSTKKMSDTTSKSSTNFKPPSIFDPTTFLNALPSTQSNNNRHSYLYDAQKTNNNNNNTQPTVIPTSSQPLSVLSSSPYLSNIITGPNAIKFGNRQDDFAHTTTHPLLHRPPHLERALALKAKLTGQTLPPPPPELPLNMSAGTRLMDFPIEFSPVAQHTVEHTDMILKSMRSISDRPITYDIDTLKSLASFDDQGDGSYQGDYLLDLDTEIKKVIGINKSKKQTQLTNALVDQTIKPQTRSITDELNDDEEFYDPTSRMVGLEESLKHANVLLLFQKGYIPQALVEHYFSYNQLVKQSTSKSAKAHNIAFNPDDVKPQSLQILDQLLEEIVLSDYFVPKAIKKAISAEKLTKQLHTFLSTTLPSTPPQFRQSGEGDVEVVVEKVEKKTKKTKATTAKTPKVNKSAKKLLDEVDLSFPSSPKSPTKTSKAKGSPKASPKVGPKATSKSSPESTSSSSTVATPTKAKSTRGRKAKVVENDHGDDDDEMPPLSLNDNTVHTRNADIVLGDDNSITKTTNKKTKSKQSIPTASVIDISVDPSTGSMVTNGDVIDITVPPKKKRRTKAEMEAARAEQDGENSGENGKKVTKSKKTQPIAKLDFSDAVSKANAFKTLFSTRPKSQTDDNNNNGKDEEFGSLSPITPFSDPVTQSRHDNEERNDREGIFGLDLDMFPIVDNQEWDVASVKAKAVSKPIKTNKKVKTTNVDETPTKKRLSKKQQQSLEIINHGTEDDEPSSSTNNKTDMIRVSVTSSTKGSKKVPLDYQNQGPPSDLEETTPAKKTTKRTKSTSKTIKLAPPTPTVTTPGVGTSLSDPFMIKKWAMNSFMGQLKETRKQMEKKAVKEKNDQEVKLQSLFLGAQETFDIIGDQFEKMFSMSYADVEDEVNKTIDQRKKKLIEDKKKLEKEKKIREKKIQLGLPGTDLIEVANSDGTVTLATKSSVMNKEVEEGESKRLDDAIGFAPAKKLSKGSKTATTTADETSEATPEVPEKPTKRSKKQVSSVENNNNNNNNNNNHTHDDKQHQSTMDHINDLDQHSFNSPTTRPYYSEFEPNSFEQNNARSFIYTDTDHDMSNVEYSPEVDFFEKSSHNSKYTTPWTKNRGEIDISSVQVDDIYSKARTQLVHQQFALAYEQQHKEQRQDVLELVKQMQELQTEKAKKKHLYRHSTVDADQSSQSTQSQLALIGLGEEGYVNGHDPATFSTQIDDDNVWYGPTHHHALRSMLFRQLKTQKQQQNAKDIIAPIPNHASMIPLAEFGQSGAPADEDERDKNDGKTTKKGKKGTKATKKGKKGANIDDNTDIFQQFDHLDKHQIHYTGTLELEKVSDDDDDDGEGKQHHHDTQVNFDDLSKEFDQFRSELHPGATEDVNTTSNTKFDHHKKKTNDDDEDNQEKRPTSYGLHPSELYRSYSTDFNPDNTLIPTTLQTNGDDQNKTPDSTTSTSSNSIIHPIQAFTSYYLPFPTDNNGIYTPYYSSISTPTFYDNLYYLSREYHYDLWKSQSQPTQTVINNHYAYKTHQLDKALNQNINHKTSLDGLDEATSSTNDSTTATSLGAPTPLPVTMHKYSHIVSSRLPLSYPLTLEDESGAVYDIETRKVLYDVHGSIYTKPQYFRLPPTLQELVEQEQREREFTQGNANDVNNTNNNTTNGNVVNDPNNTTQSISSLLNSLNRALDGVASDKPALKSLDAIDSLTNDVGGVNGGSRFGQLPTNIADQFGKTTTPNQSNKKQPPNHLTDTLPSPLPFYQTVRWPKLYPSIALPPQLLPLRLNRNLTLTTQYKRHIIENISQRDIVRFGLYSMSPYSNYDQRSIYFNDFVPRLATHIHRDMSTQWDAHTHTQVPSKNVFGDDFDLTFDDNNNATKVGDKNPIVINDNFNQLQSSLRGINALTPTVRDVSLENVYGVKEDGNNNSKPHSIEHDLAEQHQHYQDALDQAKALDSVEEGKNKKGSKGKKGQDKKGPELDHTTTAAATTNDTANNNTHTLPVKTTLPSTQSPTQPPIGTISLHAHNVPLLPSLWYSSGQYHTASDRYLGPQRGWWNKFESLDTSQGGVESMNVNDVWGYGSFWSKKGSSSSSSPSSSTTSISASTLEDDGTESSISTSAPKKSPRKSKKVKAGSEFDYSLAAITDGTTTSATSCTSEAFEFDYEDFNISSQKMNKKPEGGSLINALLPEGTNVTRGKHINTLNLDGHLVEADDGKGDSENHAAAPQAKTFVDHEVNTLFVEGMKATYTPYYGVHIHQQTPTQLIEEFLHTRGSLPSLLKGEDGVNNNNNNNNNQDDNTTKRPLFDIMNHTPTPITPTPNGFKLEQSQEVTDYDKALFQYLKDAQNGENQGKTGQQNQSQMDYDILTSTLPSHLTSWLPHIDQVFVVSGDKDVEQVISPHVTLIKHNGSAGLKYAMTKYKKKQKDTDKDKTMTITKDFFVDGELDEYPFAAVSVTQHTHSDPIQQLRADMTTSLDLLGKNVVEKDLAKTFDWASTPSKPAFGVNEPPDNPLYDLSERGSSFPISQETESKDGSKVEKNVVQNLSDKERLLGPNTASNHGTLYNTDRSKHKMHVNPISAHAYHTTDSKEQDGTSVDWQSGTSYSIQNYESSLKKYGFCPTQLPQLQALMGDSSDNIPGIKGIGPTMATKLIAQFGDVNNVLQVAAMYLGYDSIQTQVLIDRTFARRQYQMSHGIEATLGDNEMNILFNPLDCRGYEKVSPQDESHNNSNDDPNTIDLDTSRPNTSSTSRSSGDSLSLPQNKKTMKRISKKQVLLDMAQRQQLATSLDWPLSTRLTHQLLNNLDALFISLSLVTMRQDLKIPSPKHTLYTGTDKRHLQRVFRQYNLFAITDEMRTLFDQNEKSVLKGAYNGEYGELLLDAGLYLHQVRQNMGVSANDAENAEIGAKEGFLSYTQNIPSLPSKRHQSASSQFSSQANTSLSQGDDKEYYTLHHLRAKKQFSKQGDGKKDVVLTDYTSSPKYALDPNLLKIAEHSFYRPTYATYGMGSVDGKYNTSFDPYRGIMNVHQKIFSKAKAATIPNSHWYTPHPSYKVSPEIDSAKGDRIDMNLPSLMEESYVKSENKELTKYIKDSWGNTVLFMPYDIHKQFVFNLDENHADNVRGMAHNSLNNNNGNNKANTRGNRANGHEDGSSSGSSSDNSGDDSHGGDDFDNHVPGSTTAFSNAFHSTHTSRSSYSGTLSPFAYHGIEMGEGKGTSNSLDLFTKLPKATSGASWNTTFSSRTPNTSRYAQQSHNEVLVNKNGRRFSTSISNDNNSTPNGTDNEKIPTTTVSTSSSSKKTTATETAATDPTPTTKTKTTAAKKTSKIKVSKNTSTSKRKSTEVDEYGGLTAPLPKLISRNTGEQFNFFVDIEDQSETLPSASLPLNHYQDIIPNLAFDDDVEDHDDTKTRSSVKSTTTIYKDDEATQDSIVNVPKKRRASTTTKSEKSKKSSMSTSGIVLNSVAPNSLKQLPLSVVVHGILSGIDAGVNIGGLNTHDRNVMKQNHGEGLSVTNANHPGCVVVRGLFSSIVIGQEKPKK